MKHRISQFWRSIRAKLDSEDHAYIAKHLDEPEQALFYQMAVYDQRHCVDVAHVVDNLGRARGVGPESLQLLIKASLLHDVGKVKGDVGIIARSLIVVLSRVPSTMSRLALKGEHRRTGFLYSCWVMRDHAKRGAQMARVFGASEQLTYLIREHHNDPTGNTLLEILQEADCRA